MKVKSEREVTQSCPTPSDPMDCSLPGSSVHGIFQARGLEWGAIAFSQDILGTFLLNFTHPPGSSVLGVFPAPFIEEAVFALLYILASFAENKVSTGAWVYFQAFYLVPGKDNGNPLQYSCLGNPMDREPGRLQSMGSRRVRHD